MTNLVECRNLTVAFPTGGRALDQLDLSLQAGEILGIVGESGSGKTTLIRTLINLPTAGASCTGGQVFWAGEDCAQFSDKQWRSLRGSRIAMIFQNPGASLNPLLSVGRQFTASIRYHRRITTAQARDMAHQELARMQLKDPEQVLNARPWQLSGGMKQRVAIAMSLVLNPDLILADEPTSALDVNTQHAIINEFQRRRDEFGRTIVMVSHNICACARIADRLVVMKKGRIIDHGTSEQILNRPPTTYAGQLRTAIPLLKGA